ncbi:MAG: pilus assembly protein CpaF [Micromonosporaceae bacterium]
MPNDRIFVSSGNPAGLPYPRPPATANGHRGPQHAAGRTKVDYKDVKALREEVSPTLAARLAGEPDTSEPYRRVIGEEIAQAAVERWINRKLEAGVPQSPAYEHALLDAVLADMFGVGRFQPLVEDPDLENAMVKGHDQVRLEYADGRVEYGDPVADSDEELVDFLRHLARRGGMTERSLSTARPMLNMRLPGGSRLAALYDVTPRPVVVIRRHRTRDVDLDELVRLGMIDPLLHAYLKAIMAAHLNVMIVGLPGAGKTTLLRAMASEVPPGEWWATLEQEFEVHLHETGRHPWVVPIEAREGYGERGPDGRPVGEIAISDLIPQMLRLSMTRFMVGEVRSDEIVPMLETMGTCRGSLCTMHARSPESVFERIVELALRYGPSMTTTLAYQMAASALDYIVYVEMVDETAIGGRRHRFVSHVLEIEGVREGLSPSRTTVFAPGPDGRAVPTGHRPHRTADALARAGFDQRLLDHRAGLWSGPLGTVLGRA